MPDSSPQNELVATLGKIWKETTPVFEEKASKRARGEVSGGSSAAFSLLGTGQLATAPSIHKEEAKERNASMTGTDDDNVALAQRREHVDQLGGQIDTTVREYISGRFRLAESDHTASEKM